MELKTYGELKKLIKLISLKQKGEKIISQGKELALDQLLGLIPGASNAKTAFDFLSTAFKKPDTVKTNTWLDRLDIDDKMSAIIDDTVENGFLQFLSKTLEAAPDEKPLQPNFDMNQQMADYLKKTYSGRHVAGLQESTNYNKRKMKILITETQYKKLKKYIKNQEKLEEVNWRNLAATAAIAGSSLLPNKGMGQSTLSLQNKTKSNLEYLNKYSHLNKANQPLKFFKSPRADNKVIPIGSEVRYGMIKIIYDFSLGDLKFSSTNKIDKINKVNDGYQIFCDTGQVTLTAYKDNQIMATLKTYMNPKDYQEYVLSQNNEFKTIKLIKQATPKGQFNIPSGKGLIIVKSNSDNLNFESSTENLEGITYKNGFYYIPVSTGASSISVTTKDNSAIISNSLNFGMLTDDTEPKIKQGDVYYYVAQ